MTVARHRRAVASASVLDIARGLVPKPDAAARVNGALARQSGASLERALAVVHDWYDRTGVALIEKVHAPTLGWGESLRVGFSTVDYVGMWTRADGARLGVAFDAKSVGDAASIGADHVGGGKHYDRNRTRFLAQVQYLRRLRDRHHFAAFLLCYSADLETLWLVRDLDTLAAGDSVTLRTKPRATKANPTPAVVHHHAHIVGDLALAGIPQLSTRRPLFDFLALL